MKSFFSSCFHQEMKKQNKKQSNSRSGNDNRKTAKKTGFWTTVALRTLLITKGYLAKLITMKNQQ